MRDGLHHAQHPQIDDDDDREQHAQADEVQRLGGRPPTSRS
jgi:hypothetical protein